MATLSRSQFETGCKRLVEKYSRCEDNPTTSALRSWLWVEHPHVPGLGYLARRTYLNSRQPLERDKQDVDFEDIPSAEDEAAVTSDSVALPILLEVRQYVVHSATFQVPAFYFSVHTSHEQLTKCDIDGSILCLDEILQTALFRPLTLPLTDKKDVALLLPGSGFPVLSQGDHPALGTPCWYMHPCGTAKVMGELFREGVGGEQVRWMEMWLMVLGGVVNLRC